MDVTQTMDVRYQRLKELFLLAIRTNETERSTVLDNACAGDAELRCELEGLLDADRAEGKLLDAPVLRYRGPWAQECPQCHNCFDAGPSSCPVDGAPLEPAFAGSVLVDGRYRVERRLGSGGMGSVYRALHLGLDRRFALKMIHANRLFDNQARERFRHEGKALGRLEHPHIIEVTDAGVDSSGRPYLVTELLEGGGLDSVLQQEGLLAAPRVLDIVRAIAEAIDFAHQNKVIHGDIKPANVFFTKDGRVKILDFGLAELLDSGSGPRPIMGTPAYMTKALLEGAQITESADHHALVVLTYELLTGKVPFGWKPADVAARQQGPAPRLSAANPALPNELDGPMEAGFTGVFHCALDFVRPLEAAWHKVCVRQWRAREIPIRTGLSVALALILALAAVWLGGKHDFQSVEDRTRDLRFRLRPVRAPDPRIALVSFDDATLAADTKPLTARADEMGEYLERIFSGGPEGVGIDLLLPEQWSRSQKFQNAILTHADQLKLALLSTPGGAVIGEECIAPVVGGVLGATGLSKLFAFANLEEGDFVRRARYAYGDRANAVRPSLAAAVTGRNETVDRIFWLDQSIHLPAVTRWSWKDVPRIDPANFRGRYIFVGAEYYGSADLYRVPGHGYSDEISGLKLHGLIAATILEGSPIQELSSVWIFLRRCLILSISLALFLCAPRASWGIVTAVGIALLSIAVDLMAFRFRATLFPMAAEYAALAAGIVCAALIRRRRPGFPAERSTESRAAGPRQPTWEGAS
jgi:CHASE2 domain-containing sensor protein